MSKNSTFGTLLKIGGAALALHVAYKLGKRAGIKEAPHLPPPQPYVPPFSDFRLNLPQPRPITHRPKTYYPEYDFVYETEPVELIQENNDEINYVQNLVNELKSKKDKTQKDKYNIDLLEIKLKQLKQSR